jgi:long-chain acyl-CoA synthetase
MIICGGENIYCGEIEDVLNAHPDIVESTVLGIPHSSFGEQPGAIVVVRRGSELLEQDVRIFAAERLMAKKVPTRVIVRNEPLPRNDAGKVRKVDFRKSFVAD